MTNKERINDLLTKIRELEESVARMKDLEGGLYPVSFFGQTFQQTHTILCELHALEEAQLNALREEVEAHQRLLDSLPSNEPTRMPTIEPAPELIPVMEEPVEPDLHRQEPDQGIQAPTLKDSDKESQPEILPEKRMEVSPSQEIHAAAEPVRKPVMTEKTGVSLYDLLEKKSLSDFRKALSLNDRFRFRRELFGGDEGRMNEALAHLNDLGSYEESVAYLHDVLNWNLDDAPVADFIKLLEKRFS